MSLETELKNKNARNIEPVEIINWFTTDKSLTWRDILYRIVKESNLDVWNIDITLLTSEYIKITEELKEMNFQLSGDVILTAAMLLKYKSDILFQEKLKEFEELLNPKDDDLENQDFFFPDSFPIYPYDDSLQIDSLNQGLINSPNEISQNLVLKPRVPRKRQRKVSLYDLIDALDSALEIRKKHILENQEIPGNITIEKKNNYDIRELLKKVYYKIKETVEKIGRKKIVFSELTTESRTEKIQTFVALIHLDFSKKIIIDQEDGSNDITIYLKSDSLK